jgi:hypothetical protein
MIDFQSGCWPFSMPRLRTRLSALEVDAKPRQADPAGQWKTRALAATAAFNFGRRVTLRFALSHLLLSARRLLPSALAPAYAPRGSLLCL